MRPDQAVSNSIIRKGTVTHSKTSKTSHQQQCNQDREKMARILANNQRLLNQVGGRTVAIGCDSRFAKQQFRKIKIFNALKALERTADGTVLDKENANIYCNLCQVHHPPPKCSTAPCVVPAARLVCVETNPGPPKNFNKRVKKAIAKRAKAIAPKKRASKPRRRNRVKNQLSLNKPLMGKSVSLVSDGINMGSVWKNTTAERVRFPMAREKFSDLNSVGTALQTLVQQYINPGNSELFPIFSKIAQNYEQYECNHLRVLYRTEEYTASGSAVSAGLGCLATNFDPDAPNFSTFTQAENYEHSISGAPFSGIVVHDILEEHRARFGNRSKRAVGGDLSLNNYYVNYSPNQLAPGSTPAKFYDMGNFQFLVNGTQAGLIGELWIEYSFTLIRRLQSPGAPQGGVAHWSGIAATTANNLNGVLQPGFTLPNITMTAATITFPAGQPGNYLVQVNIAGATSASAFDYVTSTGGVSPLLIQSGGATRDAVYSVPSLAGTTTNAVMNTTTVNVTTAGGTLVFGASTIVGTGTSDVWIFSLPSTVITFNDKVEISELKDTVSDLTSKINFIIKSLGKEIDSDFEEEKSSSLSVATSTSSVPLTQSMLNLVNDYVAKKSIK